MTEARQGRRANRSGNTLEKTITATLLSKGFEQVSYREFSKQPERYGKELLLTNVPYKTIYGHPGNTEFLLRSERYSLEIRIECKWQQAAGSVDEKFPYVYLNCIEAMPEKHIIIVADGNGAKAGALNWLRKVAAGKRYTDETTNKKTIQVMNLVEFLSWANTTFAE